MDKDYFKYTGIDYKARYMSAFIAGVIQDFCIQEPEFEQAIIQSGKTFNQCMNKVASGVGGEISDINAIKKAVKFYFSTADVSFVMKINLSGDNGYEPPPITVSKNNEENKIEFSLDSLLDF